MAVHTRYVDLIDDHMDIWSIMEDTGEHRTEAVKEYYFVPGFTGSQKDKMTNIIDEAFKWIEPDWDITSDQSQANVDIEMRTDYPAAASATRASITLDDSLVNSEGFESTFTHELGHNIGLSHPFFSSSDPNDLDGSGYDHWYSSANDTAETDSDHNEAVGAVNQPDRNEKIGWGGRPDTVMRYGENDGPEDQMAWMDVQALRYYYGLDRDEYHIHEEVDGNSDIDFGSSVMYYTTDAFHSVELLDDNNTSNTYTIPEQPVAVFESDEPRGELDGIDDIVFEGDVDEFVFKQRGEELAIYGDNKQAFEFTTDGYGNNPDLFFDDGAYDVDYTYDGEITVGDVAITGTFDPTNADEGELV